jgi:hypothetical protein
MINYVLKFVIVYIHDYFPLDGGSHFVQQGVSYNLLSDFEPSKNKQKLLFQIQIK